VKRLTGSGRQRDIVFADDELVVRGTKANAAG
jgi:hypothetical protein